MPEPPPVFSPGSATKQGRRVSIRVRKEVAPLQEEKLLERLRRGERAALEQAVERFTPYVSAVAARAAVGIGREDLEEVTADVFLALWKHAGEIQRGSLRPWLAVAARSLGTGRLWLLTLLGGTLGNALAMLFRTPPYVALGFSTAFFSILGLLCGLARPWRGNMAIPLLAGGGEGSITIQRTTGSYHGVMAAILFISYLAAIVYNLVQKERKKRISLPWLLSIGILVQFGWEANLLLGGIRSAGFSFAEKLRPLIVNSLLETNLGMPLFYLIFIAVTARYTESLQKRKDPLTLTERIAENNAERVREQSVR